MDDGTQVKLWIIVKISNKPETDTIMHKPTSDTEIQSKVIYNFTFEILQGGGDIIAYGRTKSYPQTLTKL